MPKKVQVIRKIMHEMDKRSTKTKGQLTNIKANNLLVEGLPGSGKNYLIRFFAERAIDRGQCKFISAWCESLEQLREQVNMMIPASEESLKHIKGRKPKGYKVVVLVPISDSRDAPFPEELPENFIPYAIGADSFSRFSIRMLMGIKEAERFENLYNQKIQGENFSFYDLKKFAGEEKKSKLFDEGFRGKDWIPPPRDKTVEAKFSRRVGVFHKNGVVCSSKCPFRLEEVLDDTIQDRETVVILYTGFIVNSFLRRFCYVHFVETLIQRVKRLSSMKHRIILYTTEAQDVFKPDYKTATEETEKVVNDVFRWVMNKSRHYNIDIWMDTKVGELEGSLRGKFLVHLITRADSEDMDKIVKGTRFLSTNLLRAFDDPNYINEHGFLDLHNVEYPPSYIPSFSEKGKTKLGLRLPFPIRSSHEDVKLKEMGRDESRKYNFDDLYRLGLKRYKTEYFLEGLDKDWSKIESPEKKKFVEKLKKLDDTKKEKEVGRDFSKEKRAFVIRLYKTNKHTRREIAVLSDYSNAMIDKILNEEGLTREKIKNLN